VAYPAIDHRSSRGGRWLRDRRVRIALWIAVVEGLVVVFGPISHWAAFFIAAIIIALWFFVGRNLRSDTLRQVSWIAALSQALVALIPILMILIGTLALIAVGVIAVLAVLVLFANRP
jgi:hypothetical protein